MSLLNASPANGANKKTVMFVTFCIGLPDHEDVGLPKSSLPHQKQKIETNTRVSCRTVQDGMLAETALALRGTKR
jgi:hypothetical protein